MEVSEYELLEIAEHVAKSAEMPNAADAARAGDYLRAAQLAREWVARLDPQQEKHATPFRSFILGYLAARKDRV